VPGMTGYLAEQGVPYLIGVPPCGTEPFGGCTYQGD
jgi:hypothetical protein